MKRTPRSIAVSDKVWAQVRTEAAEAGESMSQVVNQALAVFFRTKHDRGAWETMDPSEQYDPLKFYTATEDRNGHSVQIKVTVPKNVAGIISSVVQSGKVPEYRTQTDFYRDAVIHRGKVVANLIDSEELGHEIDLHVMVSEEKYIKQQKADVEGLIQSFEENMDEALQRLDFDWAEEHLHNRSNRIDSIPERYKAQYIEVLYKYRDRLENIKRTRSRSNVN